MPKKKKKNLPKIGLALSGGSALGIAHIGVIKAFKKHKIPIDFVSGTSAGSIAATALAFDLPLEKMIEYSKGLSWGNMSKFGYSKMGLNSNAPVGELIKKMVGDARIENAKVPLAIVATDIDTGEEIIFRKGNVAEAVMASTCLPVFYVPVEVQGKKMVDGGLVENIPISPLKQMGADIKIAVDLEHWRKYKKTKSFLDVVFNVYGTLIKQQTIIDAKKVDIMIEPYLKNFTPSDFDRVNELLAAGQQAAEKEIPRIKKLLGKKEKMFIKQKTFLQKISSFFHSFLFKEEETGEKGGRLR